MAEYRRQAGREVPSSGPSSSSTRVGLVDPIPPPQQTQDEPCVDEARPALGTYLDSSALAVRTATMLWGLYGSVIPKAVEYQHPILLQVYTHCHVQTARIATRVMSVVCGLSSIDSSAQPASGTARTKRCTPARFAQGLKTSATASAMPLSRSSSANKDWPAVLGCPGESPVSTRRETVKLPTEAVNITLCGQVIALALDEWRRRAAELTSSGVR